MANHPAVSIPEDHPVRSMLRDKIVPYLLIASSLQKRPLYYLQSVHSWSGDLLTALAGTSLVPVVGAILQRSPTGVLFYGGVAFVALATVVKVVVTKKDTAKLAVLSDYCNKAFSQVRADVIGRLQESDPTDGLQDCANRISWTVKCMMQEGFDFIPSEVEAEVEKEVGYYCDKFGPYWTSVSQAERRRK